MPASQEQIPFEDIKIGQLQPGNSNPASSGYNSLADYSTAKNVIEFRIPWTMLGYTDPSTHQIWSYLYRNNLEAFSGTTSNGINVAVCMLDKTTGQIGYQEKIVNYQWSNWNIPSYHERKKTELSFTKRIPTQIKLSYFSFTPIRAVYIPSPRPKEHFCLGITSSLR